MKRVASTTPVVLDENYQDNNYNLTTVIRMEQEKVVENVVPEFSDAIVSPSGTNKFLMNNHCCNVISCSCTLYYTYCKSK